jgi:hypothetical protein
MVRTFTNIGRLKMSLQLGDEVYWNDPDNDTCSGYGYFVRYCNDEVAIITKDEIELEVFIWELT